MARRATGTIEWVPASNAGPGHWKARIRFVDGSRPWVHFDPAVTESEARLRAASLAGTAKREEWVSTTAATVTAASSAHRKTWNDWFPDWFDHQRARGLTSVHDMEGHYNNHIAPVIGSLYCDATTPRDLRALVDVLDRKVTEGYADSRGHHRKLSAKSAQNIWATLTSALDDAVKGKDAMRVLEDRPNPAAGVRGPEDGPDRAKTALYPEELVAALTCERWSVELRRMLAISVYLYLRAGELDVLEWRDIDLAHRVVNIRRALQSNGEIGPPKNGKARRVPIEPTLLPLLETMKKEAGDGRVFETVPQSGKLALYLRELLQDAGVERDIFTTDATTKRIGWHDATRATGITWRIARGDKHAEVRDDAGHQSVTTTEKYDRTARMLRHGLVTVFPELPAALFGPVWSGALGRGAGKSSTSRANNQWRRRESNARKRLKTRGFVTTRVRLDRREMT